MVFERSEAGPQAAGTAQAGVPGKVSRTAGLGALGLVIGCSFYVGLILGVSFIATVAKFSAPTLALPVALDVGRHTFAAFAQAEWLMAALIVLAMLLRGPDFLHLAVAALVGGILVTQALWLLPALDARVGLIIAGEVPPPSQLHVTFIVLETAKLAALLLLALLEGRALIRRG